MFGYEEEVQDLSVQIEYDALPSQAEFRDCDARFKGFSGPVGSGKSLAFCMEVIKLAYLNAGLPGVIAGPTYRLLADSTRHALLEILIAQDIPHYFQKADNDIHLLECGSQIRIRSLDDPLKLVGPNLAWFGVDELTYCKENSWERLEARLRHPQARALQGFAVWTPKGHDWVYRRFVDPKSRVQGYRCIQARPFENRFILEAVPDYYERLKYSYDETFYQQEALGQYVGTGTGLVYHEFDEDLDVRRCGFDPRRTLMWSLDFNVNPMTSVVCQRVPDNPDTLNVIAELYMRQSKTIPMCEAFDRLCKTSYLQYARPLEVQIYGDATGRNRDTAALSTDWELIWDFFKNKPEYRIVRRVKRQNPAVRARVATVNALFNNAAGQRRFTIDPSCKELIADLKTIQWEEDSNGQTIFELDGTDKMRTHISDALGYLVEVEFAIKRQSGEVSESL